MPCCTGEYAVLMEIKYTIQKFGFLRIKKKDHGYFCSARTHSIDQEIHNKDNHNITKDFFSNKKFFQIRISFYKSAGKGTWFIK